MPRAKKAITKRRREVCRKAYLNRKETWMWLNLQELCPCLWTGVLKPHAC